ncbi:hypothetical protein CFC21_071153 [Triticum aestivum]|uniref:Uncharacterized protein n=2 Tax=Triticum aestivum TaxID=4565 RepID=A0A3B6LKC7_WHEAT|nr:hypothetical protein CFC21_071153 [Triticum aestivum]
MHVCLPSLPMSTCNNSRYRSDKYYTNHVHGLAGDNGAARIRCREEDPDPYDGHRKVTHFFGSLRLAPLTASLRYICWVPLGVLNKNWRSALLFKDGLISSRENP